MAKTGIHIKPCNTGSAEAHNRRDKAYLERLDASGKKTYDIFRDETHLNRSWVSPDYQGRTLPEIMENLRREVKEKTGRAMQDKATPIREGVCPILPTTQLSEFQPVVDWYAAHGAAVISIDLHHDEGHTDPITGERKHNHHAHLIVDYIDHRTGRSVKLTKDDISQLQGVVADALRMERGTAKTETGAEHLAAQEYREKKAGENAARLESKVAELAEKGLKLQEYVDNLEQREAAAREKTEAAEKAASREQLRSNAADIGARVLGLFGRGAVAEANADRDEALERAEAAEQQAADDRQARDIAVKAQKEAEIARSAAEAVQRTAEDQKAAYGRERYEAGHAEGRASVADSIETLQQQLAEKQDAIDKLQNARDERVEAAEKEMEDLVAWNPCMRNWRKSVADMQAAGMVDQDIRQVMMHGSATVQLNIKHNYKDYPVETTVKIGSLQTAANKRTFGVWFKAAFDNTWRGVRSFLEKAQEHIRQLHPSQGMKMH